MKAIVTGASGFLGSALCKELSDEGYEIIAIVHNSKSNISSIENIKGVNIFYNIFEDDYSRNVLIENEKGKVDVFFHFAWAGTSGSLRGDYETQVNNIITSCKAVDFCKEIECGTFVFASSIMEDEIHNLMKTEITPSINSLYSISKIASDYMVRTVAGLHNIKFISAKISNIYGPGETSARLINSTIRKLIKGEHCSFSLGYQMYDFIYITDAAKAFVAISRKGINNRTYYIGSLEPKPLRDFLCSIRDIIAPKVEIGLGELPNSNGSIDYSQIDIFAVKKDTGFIPSIDFEQGIILTYNWIKGENNAKI